MDSAVVEFVGQWLLFGATICGGVIGYIVVAGGWTDYCHWRERKARQRKQHEPDRKGAE